MKSKRGFEFSFAWLFAIIVGATILFLAVYAAVRVVNTGQYQVDSATAKQLSVIFEPMETGLAAGKSSVAELKEETRIYNTCDDYSSFGKNIISLSTKSGFASSWKEPGAEISIPNKYIFSNSTEQGKIMYLFSMPFEFPWKVSELIFLTAEKYCFINAPEEIQNQVAIYPNIKLENCTKETRVCFDSGTNCDIIVKGQCNSYECESEFDYGTILKQGESLYYEGSLLYGGIISSKEIYECNVKRLVFRLMQQAILYQNQANFMSGKCGSSSYGLISLVSLAAAVKSSSDLTSLKTLVEEIDRENSAAECKLW